MTAVVLLDVDANVLWHLEVALARYTLDIGRDRVPHALAEVVVAIRRHRQPLAATSLDTSPSSIHDGLVTFTEASERLRVSKRTVSRRVNAGHLTTVGRRITAASVTALLSAPVPTGDLPGLGRVRR